jgi:hypothetical protein
VPITDEFGGGNPEIQRAILAKWFSDSKMKEGESREERLGFGGRAEGESLGVREEVGERVGLRLIFQGRGKRLGKMILTSGVQLSAGVERKEKKNEKGEGSGWLLGWLARLVAPGWPSWAVPFFLFCFFFLFLFLFCFIL